MRVCNKELWISLSGGDFRGHCAASEHLSHDKYKLRMGDSFSCILSCVFAAKRAAKKGISEREVISRWVYSGKDFMRHRSTARKRL